MKHLFFSIVLRNSFSFPNDIWIGIIAAIAAMLLAYNAPWRTPLHATFSLTLFVLCVILLFFLHPGVALCTCVGALLGFIAKWLFPKKQEADPKPDS